MTETAIENIEMLKVHGRTTAERAPLTLFWTASGFECNVSGTELWVEVEVTYDTYEPWISYTVNGDWVGRQMLLPGRYWLPLFRGMSPQKVKNVRLYKDLQAMSGDGNSYIHIHALRHDGIFYPVEPKRLKIEFIGDSITSGEGLFGAKEEEDWIPMFFSALRTYAHLTATELDAEYRIFSQSGWGVYHSWDNNRNNAIPKYYREICSLMPGEEAERLGGNSKHDFTTWQPDVIVINLGTNDATGFKQPEDGSYCREDVETFKRAVADFLVTLRDCNPNAQMIWCYGMLGIPFQTAITEGIASYVEKSGDRKVSYLRLPDTDDTNVGSRQHPGQLCHKQAAEVLARYIREVRGYVSR